MNRRYTTLRLDVRGWSLTVVARLDMQAGAQWGSFSGEPVALRVRRGDDCHTLGMDGTPIDPAVLPREALVALQRADGMEP